MAVTCYAVVSLYKCWQAKPSGIPSFEVKKHTSFEPMINKTDTFSLQVTCEFMSYRIRLLCEALALEVDAAAAADAAAITGDFEIRRYDVIVNGET